MEKNLKRLSLALLALGLSAPAFADNCVMVPSQKGGFKIGVDALYLRPTNSDLNYATVVARPTNFPAGFERNAVVDPSYDWGFYAQIGYLFPCTGNDLTLGYTYLRTDETSSIDVGTSVLAPTGPTIAVTPLTQITAVGAAAPFNNAVFSSASAKAKFDVNVVDLDAGQRFTTGAYDMRMFAGLRYANIDHTFSAVGLPFGGSQDDVIGAQRFSSQYRGIGPRLGVDGRYCLNSGFGLDGNLSTALLVGTIDSKYSATTTAIFGAPATTLVKSFEAKGGARNRIVPVLEAKLGVDYTHIIDCRCKSSIVFEAGYQVTNYFNAVDHQRVLQALPVTPAVALQNSTSDIAFGGPYLGVKYYA